MAYDMTNANSSALYLGTTNNVVVQSCQWYSDPNAIYQLEWGGWVACPATVGGTCGITVTFNGVVIEGPFAMQTLTNAWSPFYNSVKSNCQTQASSGVNTLTVSAQLSAVNTNAAAKIKQTFLRFTQVG